MPKIIDIDIPRAETGTCVLVAVGAAPPFGTLLCDGSTLSASAYPKLAALLGSTYGGTYDGDTLLTFNLPDWRGRTGVGVGHGANLSIRQIGDAPFGEEQHTLSIYEMPSHYHTGSTSTDGDHQHIYDGFLYDGSNFYGIGAGSYMSNLVTPDPNTSSTFFTHTHDYTVENTGGGQPHENMAPSMVCQIAIVYL